jgi:glycosyltransferase involved in cell wall biosynthesis
MAVKVLHLSSERSWRGGEQQIAYLIDELRLRDAEVHIAVKKDSEFERYCQRKKLPCLSLPFSNSLDLKTALAIKKICRQLNPDVIHLHSSKSHGIGVLSAVLGNRVPLILSRRVDFVPKNTWMTRFKYNHPSIKKILCVSEKINEIIRGYINHPEKSITVHSGTDLNKFKETPVENVLRKIYQIPSDTFIIGNTSALESHKDYFTFLDTVKLLVNSQLNIKAFIIGTGSLETALKTYCSQKGLSDHVVFTGFRKDILQVLSSLDLFLITSNEEGLGTSVLDAFAAGIPVVATAAGGIPEMVENRKTGMLEKIYDSEALARAVVEVLQKSDLRNSLIAGAKEKVKMFSKEATAEKTLKIYNEITLQRQRG